LRRSNSYFFIGADYMKYQILTWILLFNIILTVNSYSQQSWKDSLTLKDAIEMTLVNQPLIQQALEQVNAANARIKEQNSFYYPKVDANLSYVRIGPIPTIQFGGLGFTLAPDNNYDMHLSASQLVYDFGKRDAMVDLMQSYKLASEDKINLIRNNLTYGTIQIFYTILFLKKGIDVKNEQINTLNRHLEITNKKVQSGSATDFDILTTQVRVADAENQKIDIENELNKAEINLRSMLNLAPDAKLNLSGEFKIDSLELDTSIMLDKAFRDRPELKLARDAEKSALVSKQVASKEDLPALRVIANYGLKNGFEPNLDVLRGNWAAGINASIPIFNGNLRDAKEEEADANLKSSSANIIALERDITVDVGQAVADLKANMSKIKTSMLQVEHAKQAVTRAEIQYKDGVITNLDLIDAETSLAQAKLGLLQIQYRNLLSYYNLKKAVGFVFE
jgi:outer membrane protein